MLIEAITIVGIIGGSAAAVWYAKSKFQPEIDLSLERLERQPAEISEFVHKKKDSQHD